MIPETEHPNITIVRHGKGSYEEGDVQFSSENPFATGENPYWNQEGCLTPAGAESVRRSVQNLIPFIDVNEEIYFLVSATRRTIETAGIMKRELQEIGYDIGGIAITEELGEPHSFVWEDFKSLVFGERKRIDKELFRFNVHETNPDGLDPNTYFTTNAWERIPHRAVNEWPPEYIHRLKNIEPYPDVTRRIYTIIERLLDTKDRGRKKRFILVTHDASALFLSKVALNGKGIGLPEAGFLNITYDESGDIYIDNINGKPLTPPLSVDTPYENEFVTILRAPSRHDVSLELAKYPIISTIYAASSQSEIYHPPYRWLIIRDGDKTAIIGVYKKYRLFPFGDRRLIERGIAWLDRHPFYFKPDMEPGVPDNLTIVTQEDILHKPRGYELVSQPKLYKRLLLHKKDFKPPRRSLQQSFWIVRLNETDISNIHTLLTPPEGTDAEKYTEGVIFDENRLRGGLPYFGAIDLASGKLVAIIGTHGMVPDKSIAVIGDAFTLPQYRRKGIAAHLTSALIRRLNRKYHINHIGTDIRDDKPSYRALIDLGFKAWDKRIQYAEFSRISL